MITAIFPRQGWLFTYQETVECFQKRVFPSQSQGQYVCEIRSRTFPQLGQFSAAQQGLYGVKGSVLKDFRTEPCTNWFLHSGSQLEETDCVCEVQGIATYRWR